MGLLALGLVLATFIGVSLGALGAGGSILTVPILVHVLGQGMKSAVASSLVVVGVTSAIGLYGHARAGGVDVRAGLSFSAVAMVGSFFGARWSAHWSDGSQTILFAVAMFVSGVALLRRPNSAETPPAPGAVAVPPPFARLVPPALAVGVLTGLVGVGGGFLVVPALVAVARLPMKRAIGTSLLVIALNCAAGLVGYIGRVRLPWGLLAAVTAAAVVGILLGVRVARRVPAARLRLAFAALLVMLSAALLIEQRASLISFLEEGPRCC